MSMRLRFRNAQVLGLIDISDIHAIFTPYGRTELTRADTIVAALHEAALPLFSFQRFADR